MMEIEIEESGLVAPSEETPKHTIWLSNMDLMFPTELYTPTINLFPFNGDPDFFNIQHLKAALAKTLVPYYPLAGHLAANDVGRVELLCTGEGVLFVVARSSSTMDPLLHEFKPSQKMKELLIPHSESRLIMLQVTFFKCGGVCLGIATNHAVMDGLSALGFINTWGDIARGEEPNVVLWLDRTLLRARSPPIVPPEYLEQQSQEAKVELAKTSFTEPPASAMLKLSKDQVNSLKNICGAVTGRRVSTFESLAAYAWQCVCKARKLGPEEETRLHLTADARTRLKPPLPAGFFGNATLRTHMSSEVGSILSEPLPSTIQKIRDTVAHVDDEFVRSVIDILETMEDKTDFYLGKNSYGKNDVWVLSWLTLPIYADFGWGKSVFMGRAQVNSYAMFYVLRGPEEGGVTILLTLEKENMEEFIKVFYEGLEVPATVEAKTNGSLRQVEAKTNGSLPNVEATCVKVD